MMDDKKNILQQAEQYRISSLAFKPDIYETGEERRQMTPQDCITAMLRHVGRDDDMLYIPEWPHGTWNTHRENIFYACRMDRKKVLNDKGQIEKTFESLMNSIGEIAKNKDRLGDTFEENAALLGETNARVWGSLIRGFETNDRYDMSVINDISDRIDFYEKVGIDGSEISEEDREYYKEVSSDELALYLEYADCLYKEAEDCAGGVAAYALMNRAMRICELLALSAPEIVIEYEKRIFAQALVLNRYGISMEKIKISE